MRALASVHNHIHPRVSFAPKERLLVHTKPVARTTHRGHSTQAELPPIPWSSLEELGVVAAPGERGRSAEIVHDRPAPICVVATQPCQLYLGLQYPSLQGSPVGRERREQGSGESTRAADRSVTCRSIAIGLDADAKRVPQRLRALTQLWSVHLIQLDKGEEWHVTAGGRSHHRRWLLSWWRVMVSACARTRRVSASWHWWFPAARCAGLLPSKKWRRAWR